MIEKKNETEFSKKKGETFAEKNIKIGEPFAVNHFRIGDVKSRAVRYLLSDRIVEEIIK